MLNKALTLLKSGPELAICYPFEEGYPVTYIKGMTWRKLINSKYRPAVPHPYVESDCWTVAVSDYDDSIWMGRSPIDGSFSYFEFSHTLCVETTDSDTSLVVMADDLIIENHVYGKWMCYLKGTMITLSDGTVKPVEDISYEDELLVWDFDNGCFATAKALWIKKAQKSSYYYRLKFDDGSEIGLVGQDGKCHRLFNVEKQEFISGTDFHVGEHTFNVDGKQVKLMSIEIVEDEVEYYNIISDYYMNCFANGLLTSTQYNNVYPIKDMKFVKDGRELIPFEAYEGVSKKFYDGMRLGEQDLGVRSIEKTNAYIGRMVRLMR